MVQVVAGNYFGSKIDTNEITDGAVTLDKLNGDAKLSLIYVPIGSVVAWLKDYTNTPALSSNFVECNGQTLTDAESVYNGQVIPNLNGSLGSGLKGYFLRGHSSSGETESSQNLEHSHTLQTSNDVNSSAGAAAYPTTQGQFGSNQTPILNSGGTEARPHNYSVVWIMRIK